MIRSFALDEHLQGNSSVPNISPTSSNENLNSLSPTTVFILIAVIVIAPAILVAINISCHIRKMRRQQSILDRERALLDRDIVAIATDEVAATLPSAVVSTANSR